MAVVTTCLPFGRLVAAQHFRLLLLLLWLFLVVSQLVLYFSVGHKNIGCCTVFRLKHMLIVFLFFCRHFSLIFCLVLVLFHVFHINFGKPLGGFTIPSLPLNWDIWWVQWHEHVIESRVTFFYFFGKKTPTGEFVLWENIMI